MSEEFEKIKNEVNSFRQTAENKIELEKRAVDERMKKGKLILEKSGAISLFEEIRDSRLVEMSPHDLASVRLSRFKSNHPITDVASLSLTFNRQTGGDSDRYDEIRIATVGEELCLVEWVFRREYQGSKLVYVDYTYTPIKEGELATTIAKALENPTKGILRDNYENL